jgi:DHA1 family bicyclomycin/chloramphenicol resistance-like MFS transporter
MVFFYFLIGALAMWFLSFSSQDKVVVLGWMGVAATSCTLVAWQVVKRRIRVLAG